MTPRLKELFMSPFWQVIFFLFLILLARNTKTARKTLTFVALMAASILWGMSLWFGWMSRIAAPKPRKVRVESDEQISESDRAYMREHNMNPDEDEQ